jgi:hypothetical protein
MLFLKSLLKWIEKLTRRPHQHVKTGTLLLALQGACLYYNIFMFHFHFTFIQ